RLELLRVDVRTLLDDQRGRSRDDRGGLRGAAAAEEAVCDVPGGAVGLVDERAGVAEADDVRTRGQEIDRALVLAAFAVAREGRHRVVVGTGRTHRVGCPDGDQIRVV